MEEKLLGHEARLSKMEGILEDINKRLQEGLFGTLHEHGKRIREIEDRISHITEVCASERGRLEGSKATLMVIMTAISSIGGLIGAMVSRLF